MTLPDPNPGDLPDLDSMFGNPDALSLQVSECPRCEEEHGGLTFQPFAASDEFSHWSSCPRTGEPILLTMLFS